MKTTALLLTALLALAAAAPAQTTTPTEPLGLSVQRDIKAVYQVSEAAEHEGTDKGLFYARKLADTYLRLGIAPEQVRLHIVYHADAIAAVLDDAAWQRLTKKTGANPNRDALAQLVARGIHVEVCADTLKRKGVEPAEVLPGVVRVVGAYPRLVDLQLQGCAYIKFE